MSLDGQTETRNMGNIDHFHKMSFFRSFISLKKLLIQMLAILRQHVFN